MPLGEISVFLSGGAVMVTELIAARLVAPYFGQSSATWGALVGCTLAGVTLGNWLGGILSRRAKRPLCVAAFASLAGAVSLGATPFVLPLCSGSFFLTFAAFFPSSALLGMISPSIGAAFVRADRNGADLGRLYFFSMLGSMLGSAAGGLYLPFVLPADTLYCLCAGILAALSVLLFAKRTTCAVSEGERQKTQDTPPHSSLFTFHFSLLFIGFASMFLELSLARLIVPVMGGSHIVWSSIFISFIGWMGLGGRFGGPFADRFASRQTSKGLAIATAVAVYLTVIAQTRLFTGGIVAWHPALRLFVQVFLGFAPLAFLLGFVNAYFLKLATAPALAANDNSSIGRAYAISGLGSALGTFAAGMFFVSSASIFTALPFAATPLPLEITADPMAEVLDRGMSAYNTVTVTREKDNPRIVTIWLDRIPHTSVNLSDPSDLLSSYTRLVDCAFSSLSPHHSSSSPLPSVYMIGGGGYALPRKWANEKSASVIVAEIDPLVTACAAKYMDLPKPSEYFRAETGDGRQIGQSLAAEERRFDFVVGDTIGDAAIPYHLVTREFFADVADRLLNEQGVYLMHVLDRIGSPDLLSSVMLTLREVFPNVCAVAYSSVPDLRQSFVVAASRREISPKAIADALAARYPESIPSVIPDPSSLVLPPSSLVLTDRFAPVERFVWRVMTEDVQYRPYMMAKEARRLLVEQDREAAFAMAKRVLELQPENSEAMDIVVSIAEDGNAEAENILAEQAARPSAQHEAKTRYAVYLMHKEEFAKSANVWRELVRRWPKDTEFASACADTLIRSGDIPAARAFIDGNAVIPASRRRRFIELCEKGCKDVR